MVELREHPFDPWEILGRHQAPSGATGATASFVGTMRDVNEGERVQSMTLEHYPAMTAKYLQRIEEQARSRWEILDCIIIHRVGDIEPDDTIVLIAVYAAHRGPAFEACRYLIETLKAEAPFWKKERLAEGERWVAHNTPG